MVLATVLSGGKHGSSSEREKRPIRDRRGFCNRSPPTALGLHGTIEHCVRQLNDDQIWWRPRSDMNSVGNLLLHLAGNLRQRFLSDIGGTPSVRDRFAEFTERGAITRDDLLRRIHDAVGQADELLATVTVDRLREGRQYEVTAGTIATTVEALVLRTLMHLAGHTQEIVFIAHLQLGEKYGFKNPAGVPPTMRGGTS